MGNPIAFLTCYHVCPEKTGSTDHVGGNIFQAARNTCTGGMPIARVRDKLACRTGSDSIETGSSCVFCEGQPVAFTGSLTRHLGELKEGNPTVCVGEYASCGPYGGLLAELLEEPVQKQQATSDSTHSSNQAAQDNVSQNPKTTTPTVSQSEPTTSRYDAPQSKTTDEDEDHELIVEVLGRSHPEGHKFCFFEREGGDPDPIDIKGEMSKEPTDDSVIYRWDWTEEKKNERRLFMEIATESGDPIRVPFLHQARAVERQEKGKRQKHVVAPVVVSTLISGLPKTERVSGLPQEKNPHHHVLCRAGFLYFFYEDKLWREVEVTITEDGTPRYRDVPLAQYRTGENGSFEGRDREVTGVALEEIWLPSRVLGYKQTVKAAYSESQWTDERINLFEKSPGRQDDRCNLIEMEMEEQDIANGVDDYTRPARTHLMPMSVLDRQRPRAPGVEREYDRPEEYLLTTSGNYETDETSKALSVHSRHEQPDPYEPVPEEERPEMNALCNVLAGTMRELSIEGVEEKPFQWEKTQVRYAPIDDIKERNIGVIRVDDHLYRVRYLLRRHEAGAWFADAAVRRAKEREFFDSASLVQTVVLPENIGGGQNPFYAHRGEMSDAGMQKLSFSLAEHEREMAVAYLRKVQDELIDILNYSRAQEEIIELFTYYGCDYVGAFSFMTKIFQTLSKEPFECDALHALVSDVVAHRGKRWVSEVTNGGNTAFHVVLFPDRDKDDLTRPYQDPDKEQTEKERVFRSSRGLFQASKLAALEDADLPEVESVKTLDGLSLLQAAENDLDVSVAMTNLRRMAGLMMTVHGNLVSTLQDADKAALEARKKHEREIALKSAEEAEKEKLHKQRSQLNDEIEDLEKAKRDPLQILPELERRQAKKREEVRGLIRATQLLEAKLAERSKTLSELGDQILQFRSSVILRLAHYLRASLPSYFGNLTVTNYSQAVINQNYVMGIPARVVARDYERFYKDALEGAADRTTATKTLHAQGKGIYQEYRVDTQVLTMPEDGEIGKKLRELSEAETEHAQLTRAVEIARKQAKDAFFSRDRVIQQVEALDNADWNKGLTLSQSHVNRYVAEIEAKLNESEQRLAELTKSARAAADEKSSTAAEASRASSNKWYRALNHPILPIGVLLLEGYNVYSVITSWNREMRISTLGAASKGASAIYDASLLVATLGNRFAANGSLIARKTQFLTKEALKGRAAAIMAQRLGTRLLVGGALAFIGAVFTAITLVMDAAHALNLGNPAVAIAHGLTAVGVLSLGVFGVMAKGGALLMMGPHGWLILGIAAIAVGIFLLFEFSDEPIQVWLRKGPFGDSASVESKESEGGDSEESEDEKSAASLEGVESLKDPKLAYQSLLGLCMGINVRVEKFSLDPEALNNPPDDELGRARLQALAASNARLVVESPAAGLPSSVVDEELVLDMNLVEETQATMANGAQNLEFDNGQTYRRSFMPKDFVDKYFMCWKEKTDAGEVYYFINPATSISSQPVRDSLKEPRGYVSNYWADMEEFHIQSPFWYVSAQLKLHYDDGGIVVMPGPDPEISIAYDPDNDKHTVADFADKKQSFWHHQRVGTRTSIEWVN